MKLFSHITLSIRKSILLLFFLPSSCLLIHAQIGELKVVKEEPVFVNAAGDDIHIVKKGETLFAISKKYAVTVDDIVTTNKLDGPKIILGQRLVIPSTNATQTTRGINQRVASTGQATRGINTQTRKIVQEKPIYYTVKRGDDIFSIADTEEKSVSQLKEWNPSAKFTQGERVIVGKRYEEVTVSQDLSPQPAAITQRTARPKTQPQPQNAMVARGIINPTPVTRSVPTGDLGSLMTSSTMSQPQTQPQVANSIQQVQRTRSASPVTTSKEGQSFELPQFNNYGQVAMPQAYGEVNDERITSNRFYAHHKTLPIGTKINLMIPDNAGFIQVEIVGRLAQNSTADIGLSPAIVSIIEGASNQTGEVMITYN